MLDFISSVVGLYVKSPLFSFWWYYGLAFVSLIGVLCIIRYFISLRR